MDEHGEEEERDEDDVGGQFGAVLVDAHVGGTVCWAWGQGAVFVGAIAYEVIGVVVGVGHYGLFSFGIFIVFFLDILQEEMK